ncbi:hypothetical protein I5748_016880 [Clostridioides difficile]
MADVLSAIEKAGGPAKLGAEKNVGLAVIIQAKLVAAGLTEETLAKCGQHTDGRAALPILRINNLTDRRAKRSNRKPPARRQTVSPMLFPKCTKW